jgi:hypothetical protein
MARLTALANGRTTVADLLQGSPRNGDPTPAPAAALGAVHIVSVRGGRVHLVTTPVGRDGVEVPVCPANRSGRRWTITDAPISCTRCVAISVRRRALDRWCALLERGDRAADTGTARRDGSGVTARAARNTAGGTGPGPRRPGHDSRRPTRPDAPRQQGGTSRPGEQGGWRHVPAGPPLNVPLAPPGGVPGRRRASRRRHPGPPRPPIGRAPPRPSRTGRDRPAVAAG